MTTKRRLDNWLDTFMAWTLPRTIAQESVLFWSGVFALSAVLNRRVVFGERYLGSWKVHPTMYIVFVGPQGVVTKSTTIDQATRLLSNFPDLRRTPSVFTSPILAEEMKKSKDGAVYVIASEFGALMEKDDKLYTTFVDLFDNQPEYHEETVGRGDIRVVNPAVTLIGATTPSWIQMHMPPAVLSGGFGSRFIFIRVDSPRHRRLFHYRYEGSLSIEEATRLEQDLIHDLHHIRNTLDGEFHQSDATADFMEEYYTKNPAPPGIHQGMHGFFSRREAHIIKLAMIHSAATKDEQVLTIDDYRFAIAHVEEIAKSVLRVITGTGNNRYKADADGIKNFIKENGRVELSEVLRQFESAAEARVLESIVDGMIAAELLLVEMDHTAKKRFIKINPEFDI